MILCKKGEPNQMFQMLMTLIVIGMIMLLGFQLIGSIFQRSEQIDYIKFQRSLVSSVEAVAADYNARQKIELSIPRGTDELCFIDTDSVEDYSGDLDPRIISYWNDEDYISQSQKELVRNVFLVGNDFFESFTVDDLEIDGYGYECIRPHRSNIEFWAIGQARTVTIEKVEG